MDSAQKALGKRDIAGWSLSQLRTYFDDTKTRKPPDVNAETVEFICCHPF
jgi:hypothetical protein